MGDLVLTQEQVNPVLPPYSTMALKLPRCTTIFSLRSRASQQARSWHGEASNLAHAIKPALDLIGHISSAPAGAKPAAAAAASATTFSFDTAPLNKIAGFAGGEIRLRLQIHPGTRQHLQLTEMGAALNVRMGLSSWAAVAGNDPTMLKSPATSPRARASQRRAQALRSHGLNIVAIRNHMLDTQPTVIFLHYCGRGPSAKLAAGFRSALGGPRKASRPLPDKQQNHKLAHPICCALWMRVLRFLSPEKMLTASRSQIICSH